MKKTNYLTSKQIFDEYSQEFIRLEDSYWNLTGKSPTWKDEDFWKSKQVDKLTTLLQLWFPLAHPKGAENEKN